MRGAIEILGTSSATVSADELMTTLLQSEDVFQGQRQQDIREEVSYKYGENQCTKMLSGNIESNSTVVSKCNQLRHSF